MLWGRMGIQDIADKFGLRLLVVFGSHGTERERPSSDIDIAFLSKSPLDADAICALSVELVAHFRKSDMDLVDLRKAVPLLAYQIACTGRVLYEMDQAFLSYQIHAAARYADTKHLREARKAYLHEQINRFDANHPEGGANARL